MKVNSKFADRNGLIFKDYEPEKMNARLARFYRAVEKITGPLTDYSWTGIDPSFGDAVRGAFKKRLAGRELTDFHMFGMVLQQMPRHWTPRYRASVAYFLAPLSAYYFSDPGTVEHSLAMAMRDRIDLPVFGG